MEQPLVSICTLVYNHEPYLRDCFEGFVMQKTNFSFEVLVHDDASTDGSANIIREYTDKYPHIFKPIYQQENQYSKGVKVNTTIQYPRAKGKYIATCEGDDYWTDPLKLQKQVDILEQNNNVSMVYTAFSTVDRDGNPTYREYFENCMKFSRSGKILPLLLNGNFIMTLTLMFRKELLADQRFSNYSGSRIDYFLSLLLATLGEAVYLEDITGCYRNNPNGAIATRKKSIDSSIWQIYKYFSLKLIAGEIGREYSYFQRVRMISQAYIRALKSYIKGSDREFLKTLLKTLFRM